jgi:hypothetical protein
VRNALRCAARRCRSHARCLCHVAAAGRSSAIRCRLSNLGA